MDEAEELLARLGTPICGFCGRLCSSPMNTYVVRLDDVLSGSPCSEKCRKEIGDANRRWREAQDEKGRQQARHYLENYKAVRQSFQSNSLDYHRARSEHYADLEAADNSWSIGNGLFGPTID